MQLARLYDAQSEHLCFMSKDVKISSLYEHSLAKYPWIHHFSYMDLVICLDEKIIYSVVDMVRTNFCIQSAFSIDWN